MSNQKFSTPIVFIVFKRPDTTARVFAEIAKIRPERLLIVADGPRPDRPGEAEKCAAVREVVERIDWPCKVERNYSDVNLGCQRRVSSGLDWVFSKEESAIILEDDTVPDQSFFRFAQEMLIRFKDDTRITQITGFNPVASAMRDYPYSYVFSHWSGVWGWATWRRAWQICDVKMTQWQTALKDGLAQIPYLFPQTLLYWEYTYQGKLDSWAYPWHFSQTLQSGLSVVAARNLIRNIGFGPDATHTKRPYAGLDSVPLESLDFPLVHPPYLLPHPIYDRKLGKAHNPVGRRTWLKLQLQRLIHKFQSFVRVDNL